MNRYIGEANFYKGDATPSGYTPTGGAWYPNRKTGGMGSRYQAVGYGHIGPAFLAGGFNLSLLPSSMTGYGTIATLPFMKIADHFIVDVGSLTSLGEISGTSSMKGVVQFKVSDNIVLEGAGTIPDVVLKILAWSIASLEGGGDLEGSLQTTMALSATLLSEGNISYAALVGLVYLLGSVTGAGELVPGLRFPAIFTSILEGAGTIPDTLITAIAWCVSDILSEGTASGSDLRGKSSMASQITSEGEIVTAKSCAVAVWNAIASVYNEAGSMGSKLSSAGSSGDPWTAELPGDYLESEAGSILPSLIAQAIEQAMLARKHAANKAVISDDDLEVTIYDDDGETVLAEFDISEDKRTRTPK